MTVERYVRLMAGTMILLSLVGFFFVSNYWLILTAFVGLNLFQSALTGFCPAEIIVKKLFVKQPA